MEWSIQDSAELYGVPFWGAGLFKVNAQGHLVVTPRGPNGGEVDLHAITEEMVDRGIELPLLVRMPQIAQGRLDLLNGLFRDAIEKTAFTGSYRGVYPIKVNQERQLVESILNLGQEHRVGLEAGSKPELLLALSVVEDPSSLIICNGYKDHRYVELALMSQQLGRETVIVVEKLSELDTILEVSQRLGLRPKLGVRAKLSVRGHGRWKDSAGDKAKFGLSALGIMELVDRLKEAKALDCLHLLHFHIGSQVSAIKTFKQALREATRLYVELVNLGAPMGMLDVGGGLAVDYDGSRTVFDSSCNYTEAQYAEDVVSHIADACNEADVPHPDIITESGRATAAHCSILLFDVLGVESLPLGGPPSPPEDADHELTKELYSIYQGITQRAFQEAWHDANDVRLRARQAFIMGLLTLRDMARLDALFWHTCIRIKRMVDRQAYVPDELDVLQTILADTYYGNFSVFQSTPDTWAVNQIFPCLPIQRLDEEPKARGIIADLTCDSDGKLDRFVDRRDVKQVLELHSLEEGERYVMAVCLVGAYQEILGDLHNLFGDTHSVHLAVDESGDWHLDQVVEGDTVEDVTKYVSYDRKDLVNRVRSATERAIKQGRISRKEAGEMLGLFRNTLDGYTYLGH